MILVDAHVHVHPVANVAGLFDAAARNFSTAAKQLHAARWQGVLLLTEMAQMDWFQSVADKPVPEQCGDWLLSRIPGEAVCLRATSSDASLIVVAGRQIVTTEGIEVLALGTTTRIADRQSLDATLEAVRKVQAIAVLPWGVGKWLGRRGELVASALRNAASQQLFAGDNSGRPYFWPRPKVFELAESQGRPVLPGTDPLPLPDAEQRVGATGFWLDGQLPEDAPWRVLLTRLLAATSAEVRPYGTRESMGRFFHSQLALRMSKVGPQKDTLVSANNDQTPDIETSSAAYASRFRGSAGRYLLSVQTDAVRRALKDLPPGSALDVGGGHGQLVSPLREWGWQVTVHGTDPACERNLRELHGHRDCEYLNAPLFALPLADRGVDLVIAVRLLSHVPDWQRLVGEMCRVASHAVVLDYPCNSGLNALTPWLFGLKKSLEGNTRTYASFSRDELCAEFARHGFVFGREVKQFLLPMVVHRVGKAVAPLRWAESLFRVLGLTALAGSPAILRMNRKPG